MFGLAYFWGMQKCPRCPLTNWECKSGVLFFPIGHREFSPKTLEEVEAEHISDVLEMTGGNKAEAARLLGIDRRTLYRKIAEYETPGGAR